MLVSAASLLVALPLRRPDPAVVRSGVLQLLPTGAKQCVGSVEAPGCACAPPVQKERDSPFAQLLRIQQPWAAALESALMFTAFLPPCITTERSAEGC